MPSKGHPKQDVSGDNKGNLTKQALSLHKDHQSLWRTYLFQESANRNMINNTEDCPEEQGSGKFDMCEFGYKQTDNGSGNQQSRNSQCGDW